MVRATMSMALPGVTGTITRTGLPGQVCASASLCTPSDSNAIAARRYHMSPSRPVRAVRPILGRNAGVRAGRAGVSRPGYARHGRGGELVGDADLTAGYQAFEQQRDVVLRHVVGGSVLGPDRDLGFEPACASAPAHQIIRHQSVFF